jgi:ATP-dependent DNA ligase
MNLVRLPVVPPVKPMLAKAVDAVPDQPDADDASPTWLYEPKWDGFRCIAFRDGDEVVLGSRNERPLTRYFPEIVAAVKAELPDRCVVDGELVVARSVGGSDRLDWDTLSQRIHPAESRINRLAAETPAMLVTFDLLALGDESLMELPLLERRSRLLEAGHERAGGGRSVHVTAATHDAALAREWFSVFEGAGLDGVLAKPVDATYQPDVRALRKVKHHRTADCVVIGYRPHKKVDGIGSMLLGLYDETDEGWSESIWGPAGRGLRMVGAASAFSVVRRQELLAELQEYRVGQDMVSPGEKNRWNARIDNSWVPLRPERVVEVEYDQMEGNRFRHSARFLRWRPDREPRSCSYAQLEVPTTYDLGKVLSS